jgi:hypothetical protein
MILIIFIAALTCLISWCGIRIQIGTAKDDPTKANFTAEIYPLRRLFK